MAEILASQTCEKTLHKKLNQSKGVWKDSFFQQQLKTYLDKLQGKGSPESSRKFSESKKDKSMEATSNNYFKHDLLGELSQKKAQLRYCTPNTTANPKINKLKYLLPEQQRLKNQNPEHAHHQPLQKHQKSKSIAYYPQQKKDQHTSTFTNNGSTSEKDIKLNTLIFKANEEAHSLHSMKILHSVNAMKAQPIQEQAPLHNVLNKSHPHNKHHTHQDHHHHNHQQLQNLNLNENENEKEGERGIIDYSHYAQIVHPSQVFNKPPHKYRINHHTKNNIIHSASLQHMHSNSSSAISVSNNQYPRLNSRASPGLFNQSSQKPVNYFALKNKFLFKS